MPNAEETNVDDSAATHCYADDKVKVAIMADKEMLEFLLWSVKKNVYLHSNHHGYRQKVLAELNRLMAEFV